MLRTQLETTTTAKYVMEKLSSFYKITGSPGKIVVESDRQRYWNKNLGFRRRVKEVVPNSKDVHCIIHRFALA